MEQERKIGEVFEYNGEKIIVKKDSDFIYGCTLKKWRID